MEGLDGFGELAGVLGEIRGKGASQPDGFLVVRTAPELLEFREHRPLGGLCGGDVWLEVRRLLQVAQFCLGLVEITAQCLMLRPQAEEFGGNGGGGRRSRRGSCA